jgi:ABC-type transport system involved in multi-copper enzyme maturation permease subunit
MRINERLDKVAEYLSLRMNPITVKELQVVFRARRFFVVFLVMLGLLSATTLIAAAVAVTSSGDIKPAEVGLVLYAVVMFFLMTVVVFVLPGFAVAAIVSEREKQTFELLLISAMEPHHIVRGKFTALMGITLLFMFASLPFVGMTLIFGGLTLIQIVLTYVLTFMLAALFTMLCLFSSAASKSVAKGFGTTYFLIFALGIGGSIALGEEIFMMGMNTMGLAPAGHHYGYMSQMINRHGLFHIILAYGVCPLFMYASLFSLFYIAAVNYLKPSAANKSTNLRVFYLVFVTAGSILWLVTSLPLRHGHPYESFVLYISSVSLLSLVSCLFACESAVLSERLKILSDRIRKYTTIGGMLVPGSASGWYFAVVVNTVVIMAVTLSFMLFSPAFGPGSPDATKAFLAGVCVCSAVMAGASIGRFLSVLIRKTSTVRILWGVCFGAMILIPPFAAPILGAFSDNLVRVPIVASLPLALISVLGSNHSLSYDKGYEVFLFIGLNMTMAIILAKVSSSMAKSRKAAELKVGESNDKPQDNSRESAK